MVKFNYRISLNSDEFSQIKQDKYLPVILSFARSINALQFVMFTSAEYGGDSVCDKKYRTNSFFFSISVLYEGFNIIDRHYPLLSKMESFKKGFANLLSDKKFKRFKQEVMGKMRNNYCFHYLSNITPDIIEYLDFDEYNFVIADGKQANDTYYGLADLIAINMLVKDNKSEDMSDDEYLVDIVNYTMHIAGEYIRNAELIIEEFIDRTGWQLNEN